MIEVENMNFEKFKEWMQVRVTIPRWRVILFIVALVCALVFGFLVGFGTGYDQASYHGINLNETLR